MASTKSHKLQDGTDYYGINPLGYVPLLELDDGTTLREGPAIVQYIADLAPTKNLAPAAGTLQRYRLQEWLTNEGLVARTTFEPGATPSGAGTRARFCRGTSTSSNEPTTSYPSPR